MDALLDTQTGDYAGARTETLANAAYIRLATPLGTYWVNPLLGSRLHELEREKDLARVEVLAEQYAEQALQPLLNDGRARSISITTERGGSGRLDLLIEIEDATGRTARFRHPVKVS